MLGKILYGGTVNNYAIREIHYNVSDVDRIPFSSNCP